jgi:hypothetical protein
MSTMHCIVFAAVGVAHACRNVAETLAALCVVWTGDAAAVAAPAASTAIAAPRMTAACHRRAPGRGPRLDLSDLNLMLLPCEHGSAA